MMVRIEKMAQMMSEWKTIEGLESYNDSNYPNHQIHQRQPSQISSPVKNRMSPKKLMSPMKSPSKKIGKAWQIEKMTDVNNRA